MKPKPKRWRQILVLAPEEKSTLCFVLVAFALGLATKHYRGSHSIPPAKIGIHETATNAGLPAQKRADAKRRRASR